MKYLKSIIIVPLTEIIENIYRLLAHAPSFKTRSLIIVRGEGPSMPCKKRFIGSFRPGDSTHQNRTAPLVLDMLKQNR